MRNIYIRAWVTGKVSTKHGWLAGSKHTQTRGWGQLVGVNTMALVTIRWGEIPLRDRSGDAEETTG